MASIKNASRDPVPMPVPTLVVGLGPIGLRIAQAIRHSPHLSLLAAVDPAPGRAGKDLGTVLGDKTPMGLLIRSDLEEALRRSKPRLCFLATSSRLMEVEEDVMTLASHGCSVVSTSEEMSNPLLHDPEASKRMDDACIRARVVAVGAGINPGFVLDRLVLTLCQVSRDIQRVECTRVVDANLRRPQLLTKMGGGMSPTLFAELALHSGVGHVGLKDSMSLVARGLGWELSEYRESIVPEVARSTLDTPVGLLERGQIRGATQRARGYVDGQERLVFHLEIAAGSKDPRDEVTVLGTPPMHVVIPGGCSGDEATVSAAMATVPFALFGRPGLRLPTEMPPDPWSLAGLFAGAGAAASTAGAPPPGSRPRKTAAKAAKPRSKASAARRSH